MAQPASNSSMETTSLLRGQSSSLQRQSRQSLATSRSQNNYERLSCSPKRICIPSKSAIAIFVLSSMVGGLYTFGMFATSLRSSRVPSSFDMPTLNFLSVLATNCVFAILTIFYPFSGFVADIYCGRYKLIVSSLVFLWVCTVFITITTGLGYRYIIDNSLTIVEDIFVVLAAIFFILGVSSYQSNIIQFGFDQLLDVPSCYLGMFVHWYLWSDSLGSSLVQPAAVLVTCFKSTLGSKDTLSTTMGMILQSLPLLLIVIFTAVLVALVLLHKARLFNSERVRFNPYKLILKVFMFTCKNNRPIRAPSAFVYCDNTVPSRVDFAKERFGGPFDNSDVEDVKTFGRVLCILVTLAPIFILEVPVSYNVFTLLSLHSGTGTSINNVTCTSEWVILGSGSLSYIVEVLFFPFYIWIVFSVLRSRVPKIFVRLGLSVIIFLLAVLSMLTVDVAGHIKLHLQGKPNIMCVFVQPSPRRELHYQTLDLHWAVLILPNLLIGLAPKLVMATALEFISAQTPHPMKGVMVGMLFAIKGLSQLGSALLVVPFSLSIWKDGHLGSNPPVTSCSFGYFLLTLFIAMIGLVCFVVCARRYKYRVRGEEGFSQSQVEEIFDRRLRLEQEQRRFQRQCNIQNDPFEEDTLSSV